MPEQFSNSSTPSPTRETYNLDKLLRGLKHQIKTEYHLVRRLPTVDKISFLLGYYPPEKIYKEQKI